LIQSDWKTCQLDSSKEVWTHSLTRRWSWQQVDFQARACNTLAFRAVALAATHRHRARRPAPWPRARTGERTATLPWRGGRGAGKRVPPPLGSGDRPPAWRNAHGRGRLPAAQRTFARRAGRPTRRTGVRVGPTAARRAASNRAARWRQQPPTRRRNRSRRAVTITRGSSWAL